MARGMTIIMFALAAMLQSVTAIATISAVGSKFFTSDGNQFYIKGIAYQLSDDDPLVDTNQCQMDAKQMKDVGANTIRVYHVDPSNDHQGCMSAFANAGIYLFVDLDTFNTQILPTQPTWNQTQFDRFTAILDEFQQYDNTAGVFIGNEVLTKPSDSPAAPFVKAAARDLKSYRDSKNYRKIPVGYSAADIAELRPMLQDYLVCGGNSSETVDFFSLNAYEWCGNTNFGVSGYANLQTEAQGYPAPIFFSETGCITERPRTFDDQSAILGPSMDGTWSGAIIYEWIEETNDYGLVSYAAGAGAAATGVLANAAIDAANFAAAATAPAPAVVRSGTPIPISPDYSNLKSQWATLSPAGVKLSDYSASASHLSTPACPSSTPSGWAINGNPSLPIIGQQYNPTPTGSATASAAQTSATKGSATGGKEVAGMTLGLAGVMLGFVVWL